MAQAFRRVRWPKLLFFALVLALVAARWFQERQELAGPPTPSPGAIYTVDRVIDGDTLRLSNGARVRLIGIGTPETKKPDHPIEPWGAEATRFTEKFVADAGGRVRLEFDKERVDQYGRLLAYVYAGDRFLNEELVRAGLANVGGFRFRQSVRRKLRKAEEAARTERRGMWSESRDASSGVSPARVH